MRGAILLLPQYAFIVWCLVNHRDNLTTYQDLSLNIYSVYSYVV